MYNSLPRYLRDYDAKFETFKKNLDGFLSSLPDEPKGDKWITPGALDYSVKPSNSIWDWI